MKDLYDHLQSLIQQLRDQALWVGRIQARGFQEADPAKSGTVQDLHDQVTFTINSIHDAHTLAANDANEYRAACDLLRIAYEQAKDDRKVLEGKVKRAQKDSQEARAFLQSIVARFGDVRVSDITDFLENH